MLSLSIFSWCPNCSWWLLPLLLGAMLLGYLWWAWTSGARMKSEMAGLSGDLRNWKAKFKDTENRLAEAEYDREKLSGEYANIKSRFADTDVKYLALEKKYKDLTASGGVDPSEWTNKIADLESQLDTSRNTNLKLQGDYATLKSKFNEIEGQIGGEGSGLGIMGGGAGNAEDQNRIDDLEKKLAIAYENNSKMEADYATLKAEFGELEMNAQGGGESSDNSEEIEKYKLRIAELESQLASAPATQDEKPGESKKKKKKNKKKKKDKNKKKKKGKKKGDDKIKTRSSGKKSGYGLAFGEDNLQIVEGIGPKIEGLLKDAGVNSWLELANTNEARLREILLGGGARYKMHDPSSWALQAAHAQNGSWTELVNLQKGLGGTSGKLTDAKVEKMYSKAMGFKSIKPNDLKVIEGIGPKIEGLLKNAGFTTWEKLSQAKAADLQKVLDAAGPRYKLANPGTWAKQSKMAAEGDWADLKTYQDELDGGKEG